MVEPVEFPSAITLAKHEALDLVAACDELLDFAEAAGHVEVAFTVEGNASPGAGPPAGRTRRRLSGAQAGRPGR